MPRQPVDIHAHAMPLRTLSWLSDHGLADLSTAGVVRIETSVSGVASTAPLPLAASMTQAPLRLLEMDATGVGIEAVSLPPFLMASMSEDEALTNAVVREGNDGLAEYCQADPDRLVALGSVPLGWGGAADEARRCLDELGMGGIAIGSRGAGRELDHGANDELWSMLSERGTFVFLHPSGVPDPARMSDFWLPQLLGYPMETALAVARLAFSGVLEGNPLMLCLAHGGGCLPSLRGRLDMGWARKPVAHTTRVAPSELFAALHYDTAVFDTVALRRLVEDVGSDHVLLGTDHPFDLAERDPVGFVDSAGLPAAARDEILFGNAARLLHLP
jgi:aminocarboxymuconate-semialdehyde decarboxylase